MRIAVADDEPRMRAYYQRFLPRLGHEVVAAAQNGRELVEQCRAMRPDLVISDIKMPDMDGIDAARAIFGNEPVPIILVSAYHDPELFDRVAEAHVFAYLIKPIRQADLEAALVIATRRFEVFQALRKEAADQRQALEDRKLIERAKGILMERVKLSEQDAFRRLQKLARSKSMKLVEIARTILTAEEALGGSEADQRPP